MPNEIFKLRDAGFKTIFANHELFADFLHDYVPLPQLKNVSPADIEDQSERFIPLDRNVKDADTVKKITLKSQGSGTPLFVITLVEHQSTVNFHTSARLFHYISLIYDRYEAEQREKGVDPLAKGFRLPPVIPIVYFDGEGEWTAVRDFHGRVAMSDVFAPLVPQFEYILVNLNKITIDELIRANNLLSFLLIVDKLEASEGLALFQRLPGAYVEMLNNTPEPLRGLLKDVSTALMRWKGFPDEEIDEVVDHIEHREVHRMFEKLERGIKAEQAALQAERAQWHSEQAQWQQEKAGLLRQIEALKAAQTKKPQE